MFSTTLWDELVIVSVFDEDGNLLGIDAVRYWSPILFELGVSCVIEANVNYIVCINITGYTEKNACQSFIPYNLSIHCN